MKKKNNKISRILNCIPSFDLQKDFTYENAMETGFVQEIAIPNSFDLRETNWKINDQGATGSCVGWATADSLLRWHFVKKGIINPTELLSVRFIWMASKETDEFNSKPSTFIEIAGTSLKAALDISRKYGCVTDSILPFNSGKLYENDENSFFALASRLKILNYFSLIKDTSSKISDWKNWIASGNGPILVRLNVDRNWLNATITDGKLDEYDLSSLSGGHAVSIVGYTKDRLIIRNSWGAEWGDKGFAYASFEYAEKAFTEAYGISV